MVALFCDVWVLVYVDLMDFGGVLARARAGACRRAYARASRQFRVIFGYRSVLGWSLHTTYTVLIVMEKEYILSLLLFSLLSKCGICGMRALRFDNARVVGYDGCMSRGKQVAAVL